MTNHQNVGIDKIWWFRRNADDVMTIGELCSQARTRTHTPRKNNLSIVSIRSINFIKGVFRINALDLFLMHLIFGEPMALTNRSLIINFNAERNSIKYVQTSAKHQILIITTLLLLV